MSLLKFELKKIWRQKKLIWLLVVALLGTGWFFYENKQEQGRMVKEAEDALLMTVLKTDQLYAQLRPLDREDKLTDEQKIQFDSLNNMANAIFHWKGAIYEQRWGEIPGHEKNFLENLEHFEEAGGVFDALQGTERDKAIAKNAYLIEHELPYAKVTKPISPFLLLNEVSAILLGPAGLLLLLLLFGSAYTSEKEQQTVLSVRTQPILRKSFLLSKYAGLLWIAGLYIVLVFTAGLAVPSLLGDTFNDWNYPVFLETDNLFTLVPAWQFSGRFALLFLSAAAFLSAFLLAISTQLRTSFSAIMLTGFLLLLGVVGTESASLLQVPWNPFELFRGDRFLAEYPAFPVWQYALSAIVWSTLFLTAAILLPERARGLFKSAEERKPFRKGRPHQLLPALSAGAFEWRKSRRRGLLGHALIVLAVATVAGYIFLTEQVKEKERDVIGRIAAEPKSINDEIIPGYEEWIADTEASIEEANRNGEDGESIYGHNIDYFNGLIEEQKEKAVLAEEAAAAYSQGDWAPLYDYQLFETQRSHDMMAEAKKGGFPLSDTFFGYETAISQLEWMKEHNIKPVFAGTYNPSFHDQYEPGEKDAKRWREQANRKADHSGLFSLYMVFRDQLYFIPLLLLLFLVGAGFAGERGKRPTLHLLETLPIKRRSLFLGKTIHASVVAVSSAFAVFLFVVLIGTVFNRFGDWAYPVLRFHSNYEKQSFDFTGLRAFEGAYTLMPLGEYVLKALLLYTCVTLFLIALANVIGLVARQPLVVYALTAIVSAGGYILSLKLDDFAHYSPFLYLNVPKIVDGEILTLLNNPAVGIYLGCALLLGAALLLVGGASLAIGAGQRKRRERAAVVRGV